jgi:hypothetical protein
MAVTLYGNFIDYNGDRTFISVANCQGDIFFTEAEFQCQTYNCGYLVDNGEQLQLTGYGFGRYNCNCP